MSQLNSYRQKQEARRALAREKVSQGTIVPVPANLRSSRLPSEKRSSGALRAVQMLGVFVVASLIHGSVAASVLFASGEKEPKKNEPVKVVVNIPEVKVPEPPKPEPVPEPVKEEAPEVAEVEKPKPEPPKPKKKAKPKPKKVAKKEAPKPPPEPAPAEPVEPPKPSEKPRRRIVGLSMESTTTGGNGPSFGVGNTRYGSTDAYAADPNKVGKRPAGVKPTKEKPPVKPNKVASRIPRKGVVYEKPKRMGRVKPGYPKGAQKRGIEADVIVRVTIGANGKVLKAVVVKGAGADFDQAALAAARKERFKPATKNGSAVRESIQYTYRFRLNN